MTDEGPASEGCPGQGADCNPATKTALDSNHDGVGHDKGNGAHSTGEASSGAADDALRLSVPEMDCPSCADTVETALAGVRGVHDVDARPAVGLLIVRFDPEKTTADAIRDRVAAAGYPADERVVETFDVPEMDCRSCARTVRDALESLDGVHDVEPRPAAGRVAVTYDPTGTDVATLVAAIEGAGYDVTGTDSKASADPHSIWTTPRALATWVGAAFLVGGLLAEFAVPGLDPTLVAPLGREVTVSWLAYVFAAIVAGKPVVESGYASLRARSLDIDLLMGVGITSALIVDLPFEAATLAVLFSIAELLERFSMDRARDSLRSLLSLSPDVATVRRNGEERTVPVETVEVGEIVIVRPGDRVPVDGVIREGESAVDESPITGESVPVDKTVGGEVFAGSIAEAGYLEIEASAPAGESTLARVIDIVEAAEANRTERERFIDRFARYYTPLIVVGAILTVLLSPVVFGVGFTEAFVRGLTLLVVACPCAFVISTPVSVVSAVTSAARNGVLIKGGNYLEAMGEVEAIALDKTGTLTTGELGVTDVVTLNGHTERAVLSCAHALEARSEHPIAAAIADHATERGVADRAITDFEAIPGQGVRADLDGVTHYAGKPGLFEELGFELEHAHVAADGGAVAPQRECEHGAYLDLAGEVIPDLQAAGKTVVLVGTEDKLEGVIAVADTVRPEAERTVSRLHALGLDVVMLTGDNEHTARAIADTVGIEDVYADLLPEEKLAVIESLRDDYDGVAMVGDGVNDAPALSAADVGIAMGAAGTDTAIETADVALMGDELGKLPYLARLSRRSNRVIRQNVWSALAVKAVLAVGAPLGLVSVIAAIVVGDMGMSLAVTGNAMRLAGVRPD